LIWQTNSLRLNFSFAAGFGFTRDILGKISR